VASTVVIAAFAAGGIVSWYRRLPGRWPRVLAGVVVIWLIAGFVGESWPQLPGTTRRETDDHVAAGEWLQENTDPEARVMTRSFHIQYYGRRPVVALPASDFDTMMTFARARGVQYLAVDERTIETRRQYLHEPLFIDPDPPGLRKVAEIGSGSSAVWIFELDPAPPPSELPPLPLGFVGD
jgi:hypothetical protein